MAIDAHGNDVYNPPLKKGADYESAPHPNEHIAAIHSRTPCKLVGGMLSSHPDSLTPYAETLASKPGPTSQLYEGTRRALAVTYNARAELEKILYDNTRSRAVPRRKDGSIIESFIDPSAVEPIRAAMTKTANNAAVQLDQAIAKASDTVTKLQAGIDAQFLPKPDPVSIALSGEARAMVRAMPATGTEANPANRLTYVQMAIQNGEKLIADAVLSVPAPMSGLTAQQHSMLKAMAVEKFCGEDFTRLKASQAMQLHLSNAAAELGTAFKKLMPSELPARPDVVQRRLPITSGAGAPSIR
jgi:hypothetical protein